MYTGIQKTMRALLVFIPAVMLLVELAYGGDSMFQRVTVVLTLVMLGCAGCFLISLDRKMFERVALASGVGFVLMVVALVAQVLPLDWENLISTVFFGVEFTMSVVYAIGRRLWLFL